MERMLCRLSQSYHHSVTYRIQIVVVNRLILNLSHSASGQDDSKPDKSRLKSLVFATNLDLGNIGGSLRATLPDNLDDEILDGVEITDREVVQSKVTGSAK